MAYSQKVVDKFEQTLKNPKEASVGRWKPGDKDFHRVGTGIVGAPACKANEELAVKINYEQIQTIVDTMTEEQKLIMPNTNSQYGSSKDIITEESPQKPLSLYAITKCDAEQYILDWGKGVCLRLATVFGSSPRMRTDLLVNDFVYKTLTEGVLVLFQSHFKRNYIHVRDIA